MSETKAAAEASAAAHRSGVVAIVGRPNVGKSTLLNQLLGQKVAIVTPKPQTTRNRILGVLTLPQAQIGFIDTPGLHKPRNLINQRMVGVAQDAIEEADLVLWLVDAAAGLTAGDRIVGERLVTESRPLCIVLNKIDQLSRPALLPVLAGLAGLAPGRDVVPVSALKKTNFPALLEQIVRLLPEGPARFDAATFTDQTERLLVQEVVREKVVLQTRQEIPYAVAVSVDKFEEKGRLAVINATIHVERAAQKPIIIGAGGSRIKEISRAARLELEQMLDRPIYLELFVRVQEEWTKHPSLLREFGL